MHLVSLINRYFFRVNNNYYILFDNNREDVKMSVTLNYQLSIFGKFTIAPLPDVITALMNKINTETQETFLPNIINSQQIEIPSKKITTVANLGFVTQDQQYSIAILNDRIDINYNKVNDSDVDIEMFYAFSVKALVVIMDYFGIASNRLAINIQRICEFDSFEKLQLCGKNLVASAAYYNDKEFAEWSTRINSKVNINLDEHQEMLNVITDISSGQDITGQKAVCLFHIDINTAPQNQSMRFRKDSLPSFVQNAKDIAIRLIGDVERLIMDDK